LWPAERWKNYLAANQPHYDEIAETALGSNE